MQPGAREHSVLLARDSALSLLARSIALGHGRLAVVRLCGAAAIGAEVPPAHWVYCRLAAQSSGDPALQDRFLAAAAAAQRRGPIGGSGSFGSVEQ